MTTPWREDKYHGRSQIDDESIIPTEGEWFCKKPTGGADTLYQLPRRAQKHLGFRGVGVDMFTGKADIGLNYVGFTNYYIVIYPIVITHSSRLRLSKFDNTIAKYKGLGYNVLQCSFVIKSVVS